MSNDRSTLKSALALKPLAACLAGAFMAVGVAGATTTSVPAAGHVAKSARTFARHPDAATAASLRSHFRHEQSHRTSTRPAGVTLPVTSCTDDSTGGTLREVVTAAADGDTVDLSALTCSSITLTQGAISTSVNNLTLIGPSASALTIDGANAGRVLDHAGTGTFTVDHLTISHGRYDGTGTFAAGGCIYTAGDINVTNSNVSDCSVGSETTLGFGGGIAAAGSATLTHVTVTSATATGNGGGVSADTGALVLESSTVSGNSARRGGGIYSDYGDITVNSSTISGNNTSNGGGGVYTSYGQTMTVSNSTISGNTSATAGGGIATYYGLSVRNSTVAFNTAPVAGGIYLFGAANATIVSSIVSNNTATTGANDIGGDPFVINGSNNVIMSSDSTTPGDTLTADPGLVALAWVAAASRSMLASIPTPSCSTSAALDSCAHRVRPLTSARSRINP